MGATVALLYQTNLYLPFDTGELSLSLLLQSCGCCRRQGCGSGRVKASFAFELIHMLIYFKYPCITTGVFLAAPRLLCQLPAIF